MNKHIRNLVVVKTALFAAILTSCIKEKPEPEPAGQIAVNLSADISSAPALKVANDQWEKHDSVGLFMKKEGQQITSLGAVYEYADNVKMGISGQALVAKFPLLYPENGNVDFVAYYPHTSWVNSDYTIDVDVANQSASRPVEVLYSNNATNRAPTISAVPLNFDYSLAKIELTVHEGKNNMLTASHFANMTVSVEGMYTKAKLQLVDGAFTNRQAKKPIKLHKTGSTATSATFKALVLPTDEPVAFIFNIDGDTYRYEAYDNYEAATRYMLEFTLDVPVRTATLLNSNIAPRTSESRSYVVDSKPNEPVVYIAGYQKQGGINVATLWKNGIAQNLSDGSRPSYAYSVYATGRDVYVVGDEKNAQGKWVATLWKNGVAQNLSNGTYNETAKSVFISGNDVYVAGYGYNVSTYQVAKLWKNGVVQYLSNQTRDAYTNSVYVSGSDVYVAGYEKNAQYTSTAKLWKNGVLQNLSNGTREAKAHSVYVSGNDVYVAGYEVNAQGERVAKLWKNGVAQNLSDGKNYLEEATSVYVSGSDVYVAGSMFVIEEFGFGHVVKLWKNGIEQNLTDESYTMFDLPPSVFVSGEDVYVLWNDEGYNFSSVKLWKNGIVQDINEGSSSAIAYSVFVK